MEKQIYPFIDPRIEQYCESMVSIEAANLAELDRQTHLRCLKPRMLSGNRQGTFLKILSHLIKPSKVLEIGTFTGYATLCLADGLADGGIIHTIERDEELEEFLQKVFQENGLTGKVKLHIGNALEILPTLDTEFDIVFMDADKAAYGQYYSLCKPLLKHGGLLIADNVLWYGKVALADAKDKETQAIRAFNALVSADEQMENVIVPLRDGLMVARKK
ncbi:MAG: O-methyltransferase [Bacteroidales bacterium]|jgi:predicted O-methyltransferase YrrM|nr:O-methyltransferase [Bacteroidales bacterium]